MKRRIHQLLLMLFVFCLLSGGTIFAEDTQGRAIICVQANTGLLNSDSFHSSELLFTAGDVNTDGMLQSTGDEKELRLITSDTLTSEALAEQAALLPGVLFAEPDRIITVDTNNAQIEKSAGSDITTDMQTDQMLSAAGSTANYTGWQWGNKNTAQFMGTAGVDIVNPNWNTTATKGDVVAAVVDTGIDYNHPDLKNMMWQNNGRYNIGGGNYGCTVLQKNSKGEAYDPSNPADDHAHGTHCAGIMASEWNNIGTSGAVSGIQLMAVKVLDDTGHGFSSDFIKGFAYVKAAILAGVNIRSINYSVGEDNYSDATNLIFSSLGNLGCVIAKASGNENNNLENMGSDGAPNSVIPSVVVVNALKNNQTRASFSNYGRTTTDVFAPGQFILSTVPQHASSYNALLTQNSDTAYESFEANSPVVFDFGTDTTTNYYMDGSRSLVAQTNASGNIILTSQSIQVDSASKALTLYVKADSEAYHGVKYIVSVKKEGSEDFTTITETLTGQAENSLLVGALPADTDFNHFTIKIELINATPNTNFCIDSLGLCTEKTAYAFYSGTSMAAPYVAAEAAYLAQKYPNEDAATIAARIKGGVVRSQSLKDLSRSDGTISFEAADNPYPVIHTAVLDSGSITITGSFFGTTGAVSIGGTDVRVINRSDTKIVCAVPDSLQEGVNDVVVNSERGYGRASFELGSEDNLYENKLATINRADYLRTMAAALKEDTPVMAVESAQNTLALYAYNTNTNTWSTLCDFGNQIDITDKKIHNMVFKNGDILFVIQNQANQETSVYIANIESAQVKQLKTGLTANARLIKVADRLIAVDGSQVYELNPATGELTVLGSLPKEIFSPALANGPESNSFMVLFGGNANNTQNTSFIKVTLKDTDMTYEILTEAFTIPDGIDKQSTDMSLMGVKDGLILTGLRDKDGYDTYQWRYAEKVWQRLEKKLAAQKAYNVKSWVLNGQIYTYGEQSGLAGDTGSQQIFRATAVNTVPLYVNTSTEAHVQNIGWQPRAASTHTAGTTGQALRMEALKIDGSGVSGVNLIYDAHVQNIGWQSTNDTANWKQEGQLAGTTGKALRMEAVRIALTGDKAAQYDVFYRAHVQNVGWQSWVKNGETAGSTGKALRMEALEVVVLPKGETPEN